jgi:small multidrug resistance family-3 protein
MAVDTRDIRRAGRPAGKPLHPRGGAFWSASRRSEPPITLLRTLVIFVVAVLAEVGGTYAIWRWLRTDSPPFLALVGAAALFGYAVVQTLQPEDRYGRLFAAYAGVFLIGAMLWGWGVDGKEPDRFDWIGATIVLFGVIVILAGRRLVE